MLVFDEAQRAFDADMVRRKHEDHANGATLKSEPEHFVEFAERIPEWCVVVGLIGSGQEIHVGEEAGLVQWRWAVERAVRSAQWTVHGPLAVADCFDGCPVTYDMQPSLNLDTELRFHFAGDLHRFVAGLLDATPASDLRPLGERLERDGFHLRLTRSLDTAKDYLRQRYGEDPDARFGVVASSKDRDLEALGIPNDFQSTKRVRVGPWYGNREDDDAGRSVADSTRASQSSAPRDWNSTRHYSHGALTWCSKAASGPTPMHVATCGRPRCGTPTSCA